MYSLKHLFTVSYWFSSAPFLTPLALWLMAGFFGVLFAAAIILSVFLKKSKYDKPGRRGLKKIISFLIWMSTIGFLFLFFRYEFVAILSRRFMFGLWWIGFITWLALIIKYFMREMPRWRRKMEDEEKLKKYLP